MSFFQPEWLFLLPGAPALGLLIYWHLLKTRRIAGDFGYILPRTQSFRPWIMGVGMLFLIFSLAKPGLELGEKTVPAQGQDSVFLVDVSRSMLSTDITPNRLERLKISLEDLSRNMDGDRVALYAFAGSTVLKVPFTRDTVFFRQAVEELSLSSASRGGTLLGDSLRTVLDTLLNKPRLDDTVVYLLTDGGDQESFPVEAAKRLGDKGGKLVVIGYGTTAGALVPGTEGSQAMEYKGEKVNSVLNVTLLEDMAKATLGGYFQSAQEKGTDLTGVYRQFRATKDSGAGDKKIKDRLDLSLWFLFPAFLFFALDLTPLIRTGRMDL